MSTALILLLLTPSLARAQELDESVVVMPLSALPKPSELEQRPPERLLLGRARLAIQPGEASKIQLTVPLFLTEAGWIDLPVLDEAVALNQANLDGRPVRLKATAGHYRLAAKLSAGSHLLSLGGSVASPGAALHLSLGELDQAPLEVSTAATGLDFTVQDSIPAQGGRWDLPPRGALDISWVPARPPPPRPRVVTVESAWALRVDEAGVEGSGRLHYRVVNGSLDELTLRVGAVQDLVATGPAIASSRMEGDRAIISLKEPLRGELDVAVSFRAAAPGPDGAQAPIPEALDGRGESWVSLVRGDDSVLLPESGPNLEPVPERRLPVRARGLVPGEPLVSYHIPVGQPASLRWRRLSFSPVDAPPTLVDEASYVVVHAEHGRAWMRATWQVRNDRNPFLRVAVPEGWQVFGLRVAGRTTEPVRAEDGRLLIPLEKSVETMDGLVAFPVELMLVGDEAAWDPRGSRAIATPAVDAPIAYARWELRLPAGVEARDVAGRPTVVQQWTPQSQGMVIGRGTRVGAKSTETPPSSGSAGGDGKALSQEYWNQAYSAYKANRFDEADQLLEQSLQFDSSNSSAQSLLKNVDVLKGRANLDADEELAANRVREMARARTSGVELEQANREAAYERAVREGDEDRAEAEAEVLLALTEQLAAVEQAEAVDQKARLDDYRQRVSKKASGRGPSPSTGMAVGESLSIPKTRSTSSSSSYVLADEEAPTVEEEPMDYNVDGAYGWDSADDPLLDSVGYLEGVEGGVAGGVVGGVVGGVLGGAVGGKLEIADADKDDQDGDGRDFGGRSATLTTESTRGKKSKEKGESDFSGGSRNQNAFVVEGQVPKPDTGRRIVFDDANLLGELASPQGSPATAAPENKPVDPATISLQPGQFALLIVDEKGGEAEKKEEANKLIATLASPAPVAAAEAVPRSPAVMPPPPPPRVAPAPRPAPQEAQADFDTMAGERLIAEESDLEERVVVNNARRATVVAQDEESADRGAVITQDTLQRIPAGRSYETVLTMAAGVSAHERNRSKRPPAPPPPPPPPPPETFPQRGGVALSHPLRPPAPAATPWGLDIPGAIEASTLSLSMPETGSGLLLEQRLVPADESLRLDLRYRTRRRP